VSRDGHLAQDSSGQDSMSSLLLIIIGSLCSQREKYTLLDTVLLFLKITSKTSLHGLFLKMAVSVHWLQKDCT